MSPCGAAHAWWGLQNVPVMSVAQWRLSTCCFLLAVDPEGGKRGCFGGRPQVRGGVTNLSQFSRDSSGFHTEGPRLGSPLAPDTLAP